MCGIIGYAGKDKGINVVINGLKNLEYRGYDSAGIAFANDGEICVVKESGKLVNLESKLDVTLKTSLAIGHTRWATHGEPNKVNAHPHSVGKVTIVHNGIIENYSELKEEINFVGKSETDTEVLAAYIDRLYDSMDILSLLDCLKTKLRGSYALGIILSDDDNLYCIRKDSPLIIGLGENENYIASDVPAIMEFTKKYYLLDNDEYAKIGDDVVVYKDSLVVSKEVKTLDVDMDSAKKNGYDHYMLKEIFEQPSVLSKTMNSYVVDGEFSLPDLSLYTGIDIVGCGSAYHVGMAGKDILESKFNIPVRVYVASEYRYQNNFYTNNHLVIFISQSGETADTLACLTNVKSNNIKTLAIVNVVGSSIARMADDVLYIRAGVEKAVATTKAYTCQLLILLMLAYRDVNMFDGLVNDLENVLSNLDKCKNIAKRLSKCNDVYFLGRLGDYSLALEGSLKLKEISYIHSEAYPAGELKHGTISLITEGTVVISIISEEGIVDKTVSNVKETKARGAYSVVVTNKKVPSDIVDDMIFIDNESCYTSILIITYLQLISYYTALELGEDIDMPRNLAKSVTVE